MLLNRWPNGSSNTYPPQLCPGPATCPGLQVPASGVTAYSLMKPLMSSSPLWYGRLTKRCCGVISLLIIRLMMSRSVVIIRCSKLAIDCMFKYECDGALSENMLLRKCIAGLSNAVLKRKVIQNYLQYDCVDSLRAKCMAFEARVSDMGCGRNG